MKLFRDGETVLKNVLIKIIFIPLSVLLQVLKISIAVHWRYFPDFKLGNHAQPVGGNVGFDGVVHEYFTIFKNGKVRRTAEQEATRALAFS